MPLEPGSRFGAYQVVEPIGAGGMGEVWRATDTNLKRDVALKVLPQAFIDDPDRLARFQREAEILATLNHSNIAQIYGLEKANDRTVIVMELVNGQTLADRIRAGPLPPAEAIDVGIQICNGIEAAHARGVVHRDLKPANIKLRDDGVVKVLDFGIAKSNDSLATASGSGSPALTTPALTETGMILGTAAYMSPEQARGKPLDARTDIWAFGALMYEMLTGQPPFLGEDVTETIAAVLKSEPDWNALPPLPPLLTVFIRQCLKKDPRDRIRDLADVRLALAGKYDDSQLSSALADGSTRRTMAPWLSRFAAAAIGLVIGALGIGLWTNLTSSSQVELSFRQLTFRRGDVGMARFAPDGQVIVYSAAWDGGRYEIYTTRTDSFQSLHRGFPSADLLAISGSSEVALSLSRQAVDGWQPRGVLALADLAGGAPTQLQDEVVSVDFAPNGDIAAIARLAGTGMQVEFPVGSVIHSTSGQQIVRSVRISPDGESICFTEGYGSLYVSGKEGPATAIGGPLGRITDCAWSPDGSEIWFSYARDGGTYSVLEAITPDGDRRRVLAAFGSFARLFDVSPSGQILVALGDLRYSVYGSASPDDREHELSVFDATRIGHLNAAGTQLLLNSGSTGSRERGRLFVRSIDGSDPVQLGDWQAFALTPDDSFFVALGDSPEGIQAPTNTITLVPVGAGTRQTITLPVGVRFAANNQLGINAWEFRNPEFSRDGNRLLLPFTVDADGIERAYVYDFAEDQLFPVTPEGITGPAVLSPDGEFVAYHRPDGLYTYSIATDEHRRLPGDQERGQLARWSEDQRSLYVVEQDGAMATIYRRSFETGVREPVRTVRVADPAGVTRFELWVSADGEAYAYTLDRQTADLFLLEGVN